MRVQAKREVDAAQSTGSPESEAAILALGGDKVHMGFCAAHDKDELHLSTPDGNVPIEDGAWLVKDGDELSIMSDEDFKAVYAVQ